MTLRNLLHHSSSWDQRKYLQRLVCAIILYVVMSTVVQPTLTLYVVVLHILIYSTQWSG